MSLTGKSLSQFWKDLLHVDNNNNSLLGTKRVKTGSGVQTPLEISTSHLSVKPKLDATTTFSVETQGGAKILEVDTSNTEVTAGSGQHVVNTMYKEFGLFDFSPTAGYHAPMITTPMMVSDSGDDIIHNTTFGGNGSTPAATLTSNHHLIPACAWYIEDVCKIDSVRLLGSSEGTCSLKFYLYEYDMDVSTDYGDLSGGTTLGSLGTMSLSADQCKTATMILGSGSTRVAEDKVVVMFCESNATDDITVKGLIKYHLL